MHDKLALAFVIQGMGYGLLLFFFPNNAFQTIGSFLNISLPIPFGSFWAFPYGFALASFTITITVLVASDWLHKGRWGMATSRGIGESFFVLAIITATVLFLAYSGYLGPYGMTGDVYHLIILTSVLFFAWMLFNLWVLRRKAGAPVG